MSSVARLQRFALNPIRHTYYSVTRRHNGGPKVLLNSFPKSGTYLLRRCLELMSGMVNYHDGVYIYAVEGRQGLLARRRSLARMGGNMFVQAHMNYTPEAQEVLQVLGLSHVLIVRDPRDVVLSFVRFQMSRTWLPFHDYMHALPSDDARIRVTIVGDAANGGPRPLGFLLRSYLAWPEQTRLLVRFEDLVGERGGGSHETQRETVTRVLTHVGLEATSERVEHVASNLFDTSARTFRKGTIGGWRERFSAENITLIKQEANDELVALGYEQDDLWR